MTPDMNARQAPTAFATNKEMDTNRFVTVETVQALR